MKSLECTVTVDESVKDGCVNFTNRGIADRTDYSLDLIDPSANHSNIAFKVNSDYHKVLIHALTEKPARSKTTLD